MAGLEDSDDDAGAAPGGGAAAPAADKAPARNLLEDSDSDDDAPARGGGAAGSGSDDDGSGSEGGERRRKRRDRSSHELEEDDYELLDEAGVTGHRRPTENKRKRLQRAGERAGAAPGGDAGAAGAAAAPAKKTLTEKELKAQIFATLGEESSDDDAAPHKAPAPLDDDVPLDGDDEFDEMRCALPARGPWPRIPRAPAPLSPPRRAHYRPLSLPGRESAPLAQRLRRERASDGANPKWRSSGCGAL